jgi:peptide/nickel transport system substrate-binding protein
MFFIYVLNMSHPRMADPRLRRALNLAIDRRALSDALWEGQAIPARAHDFKGFGAHDPYAQLDLLRFDPAEARRLLRAANYNGEEIELAFQSTYYTYGDLAAQAVADMWKDVGIRVKLQVINGFGPDAAKYMTRDWSNPLYFPDLMGAFDPHWSASSWVTVDRWFRPDLFPQYQPMYDAVRYGTDAGQRVEDYRKLITFCETEMVPWVLLYQPSEAFAMRSDIAWEIPRNVRPYQLTFRAGQIGVTA